MDIQQHIKKLTPEAYQRLCFAVETGKWPEGVALSAAQRDHAMQVIMLYQARFNQQAEHMTVAVGGELKIKTKRELQQELTYSTAQQIPLRQQK